MKKFGDYLLEIQDVKENIVDVHICFNDKCVITISTDSNNIEISEENIEINHDGVELEIRDIDEFEEEVIEDNVFNTTSYIFKRGMETYMFVVFND